MDPHYVAHDSCPFIAQYGLQTLVLIPSHGCHLTQRHTDVHLMDEERHTDGDENVERITAVGNELKLHPKISKPASQCKSLHSWYTKHPQTRVHPIWEQHKTNEEMIQNHTISTRHKRRAGTLHDTDPIMDKKRGAQHHMDIQCCQI
eukprot:923966_1